MPFINASISVAMSRDQKKTMKEALGQQISIFRGKSEEGLMIELRDECELYHGGIRHPGIASFRVHLFGSQEEERYLEFTRALCETCEKVLQIDAEHVYIIYETATAWGSNYANS